MSNAVFNAILDYKIALFTVIFALKIALFTARFQTKKRPRCEDEPSHLGRSHERATLRTLLASPYAWWA